MSNSEKILKTLSNLIENGILSSKDIQKSIMKGIRNVRFDNPSNIVNSIHMYKLQGKQIQKMDEYEEEVDKITLDQVNKAIQNIGMLHTVVVGSIKSI